MVVLGGGVLVGSGGGGWGEGETARSGIVPMVWLDGVLQKLVKGGRGKDGRGGECK